MNYSKADIIEIIYGGIDELNSLRGDQEGLAKSPETVLMATGEGLDSLSFVNLVSVIEQTCEQKFGKSLMLTPGANEDVSNNPFATVNSLAEHVKRLLLA